MRSKIVLAGVTLMLAFAVIMPAFGQEADAKTDAAPAKKPTTAAAAQVTQAELAQVLVEVLGLARFLPASPTAYETFAILLENGVSPGEGWKGEEVVTRADLARVIVEALGRQNEVENPDDPRSWINFLSSIGVPIGTVGEAVDNLEALPEAIAPNVFQGSTRVDPLVRRTVFGEPDEQQFGTDASFDDAYRPVTLAEIQEVIVVVPTRPRPRPPVTDN
ncbi:MAG: hypothetical protein EOM20_02655 [Spartobacteria bacterium]|nr:hypothetical protein [Spartobacteria bacterium]